MIITAGEPSLVPHHTTPHGQLISSPGLIIYEIPVASDELH